VLGLLAGLAGAVLLSTVQLERRTATAYQRLQDHTGVDDARVPAFGPSVQAIAELPEVASSWSSITTVSQLQGPQVTYVSVSAGPPRPKGLLNPKVMEGRLPSDDRADEVLVGEELAHEAGLRPGSVLDLKMLTADEVYQFDTGFGQPDGIGRYPAWGGGLGFVLGTPAFASKYAAYSPGGTLLLRLKNGPHVRSAFEADVARVTKEQGIAGTAEFGPPKPVYSRPGDPAVLATQRVLSVGLLVFLAVALAASLLAVLQALTRHAAGTVEDQQVEAALGLTRAERRLARLFPAVPAALLAGLLAVLAADGGSNRPKLRPFNSQDPQQAIQDVRDLISDNTR
jgi:hypothetical protein